MVVGVRRLVILKIEERVHRLQPLNDSQSHHFRSSRLLHGHYSIILISDSSLKKRLAAMAGNWADLP